LPPDFFNSREDVLLIYSVAFALFAVKLAPSSALGVLRAAYQLIPVFALALLPPAAFVYLAFRLGWWHTSTLKETIYWFTGTAIVLVGGAISRTSPAGPDLFPRILPRILGVTLVIECVANLYAFPLGVEFVLVTAILVCAVLEEVWKDDPKTVKRSERVSWTLSLIGFAYLGNFLVRALTDLDNFLSRDTAEDFLVGPILTITVIPLLYLVSWFSRHQVRHALR
jgi:hypothetical protein